MDTVYWICAVVGGTVIVCQFVLTLMGIGGDHDVDGGGADVHADFGGHDVGHHGLGGHDVAGHHNGTGTHHEAQGHPATNWLFGLITFRTIIAGLAFFGLIGLALLNTPGVSETIAFLGALAAGALAVVVVGLVMRSLSRLNIDGTVRIQKAVGATGTVYLTIPGANGGTGKIHVSVQNQLKEYRAMTPHADLPTGTKVVVVKVIGSDTVEVTPAESLETSAQA